MSPWHSGHENFSEDNNKLKLSYKTVGTAYSPINVLPEGFEVFFSFKENLVEDLLYNTLKMKGVKACNNYFVPSHEPTKKKEKRKKKKTYYEMYKMFIH